MAMSYAEADPYYASTGHGAYGGAALGYPYAYSHTGYAHQPAYGYAAAAAASPLHTIGAPVIAGTAHIAAAPVSVEAAPVVAEVHSAEVPRVTSSQFHSQDEDKNYAFGYSNINSARQESGNALTGVTGSYSDGFRTYNYVADGFGFRHV